MNIPKYAKLTKTKTESITVAFGEIVRVLWKEK